MRSENPATSHQSEAPSRPAVRRARARLPLRDELLLALLPTAVVLLMLGLVEALTAQRLLFASLAASAFLIYLDPEHGTNRVRVLVVSQLGAACLGWACFAGLGPGYLAAGLALSVTSFGMVVLDLVHPPAIATAMSFALRAGDASSVGLFSLALVIVVLLVALQRSAVWSITRLGDRHRRPDGDQRDSVT